MGLTAFLVTQGLNAAALAALLFFISIGLTLIFGIMRIVNFAHGALYMLGAYTGFSLALLTGSYWLALIGAPILVGVLGLVIEGVAVAFAGLFLAQAMAALPSHNYAMPANAFVLVLLGVIVEFFARGLLWVRRAH